MMAVFSWLAGHWWLLAAIASAVASIINVCTLHWEGISPGTRQWLMRIVELLAFLRSLDAPSGSVAGAFKLPGQDVKPDWVRARKLIENGWVKRAGGGPLVSLIALLLLLDGCATTLTPRAELASFARAIPKIDEVALTALASECGLAHASCGATPAELCQAWVACAKVVTAYQAVMLRVESGVEELNKLLTAHGIK